MDGKSFGWSFAVNSAATKSSGLVVQIFAINIRPTVGKETSLSCTMYYGLCGTTKAISRCSGLSQDAFFFYFVIQSSISFGSNIIKQVLMIFFLIFTSNLQGDSWFYKFWYFGNPVPGFW